MNTKTGVLNLHLIKANSSVKTGRELVLPYGQSK